MASPKSERESGNQFETSPLVPDLPQITAIAVERADNTKCTLPLSTALLDSNGSLRLTPKIEPTAQKPTKNTRDPGSDHSDEVGEVEAKGITPRALPPKKQVIILSDDDEPLPPKSGEQDTKRLKKKRPIMDIELSETELDTKVEPPLKRGRHESTSTSPVRRSKIKKYTRKRSPSSPAMPASASIDFDTIPSSTAKKARASEMKGKNGKPVPKVKVQRKQIPAQKKQSDVSGKTVKEISHILPVSSFALKICRCLAVPFKKSADAGDIPQIRRSARLSKIESPVKETSIPKIHKNSKAPWEDPNFSVRNKASCDPVVFQREPDGHLIEDSNTEDESRGDVPSFDAAEIFQASPQRHYSLPHAETVRITNFSRVSSI